MFYFTSHSESVIIAWEQRKFKNLFDFLQNNALSRAELSDNEGAVLNVHYGDILVKFGEMISVQTDMLPHIVDDSIVNKYSSSLLQNGDIVIADAAEDETVGKCSEIADLSDVKVLAGLHTIPVRPKEKFACGYLGYCLNSNSYHDQLLPLMQGTKVSSISKSAIQDTTVFFPKSAEEQQQIGSYFANLDNLITLHQRMEKMYLNLFFLSAWEQRKLSELGEIITGSTPSTQHSEYYSDNGILWVTPTDISDNITYETARKLSKEGEKVARVVPSNTILVTCIASIGKNTMLGTTGSFNQQINALVPNQEKYNPYFLFTESSLWSKEMQSIAAQGTMQIINKTEFSALTTYAPTLDEQKQIGSYFANLDNLITLHQRNKNSPPEQLHSVTVGRVSFRLSRCFSLL